LNDQYIIEEVMVENFKFLESNKSENTAYQNFCDTASTVQRQKFRAMSDYIKKNQRALRTGMVVYVCNPSYVGGIDRGIVV
jgi:hypothetical protein